jgi:23S rRNA pseudouridine1911/1915/1917 synthase
MGEIITIIINDHGIGERLDSFLVNRYPGFSRSYIQNMIKRGDILVNAEPVKTGHKLIYGDTVTWQIQEAAPMKAEAEDIGLDILYEDSDIIVINKPQGMVVHPAAGHAQGTLVNALLHHCHDLSGINGVMRPGIVHRIDKDTSGVLVAAKNDMAHLGLTSQWKGHHIRRIYHALVNGIISEDQGSIDAPIARHQKNRKKMAVDPHKGKNAITHYRVLERFAVAKTTYLELTLETGRTHQIRVHMAYLGYPVLGDAVYGPKKQPYQLAGQALHAKILGFRHPVSNEYLEFASPLPEYFQQLLKQFRAEDNRL